MFGLREENYGKMYLYEVGITGVDLEKWVQK